MNIAVPYENGLVFQHFGKTEEFKIFETENGKIEACGVVKTLGSGHGALAGFLKDYNVDAVICGGIGGGAKSALAEVGIQVYGGVEGETDAVVASFLDGTLEYVSQSTCGCGGHDHHHDHGEGGCGCGEHEHDHAEGGCGCGGHEHHHDHGEGGCGCGGHHE